MGATNNLAESAGAPKIVVMTAHIERAIHVMKAFIADHAPTKEEEAEYLLAMDRLTFDDVMLAATLLATVERASNSSGHLWTLITPLLAEGVGSLGWLKGDIDDWIRAQCERQAHTLGKPNNTKAKAVVKISHAA